jgi:hypothetical protein
MRCQVSDCKWHDPNVREQCTWCWMCGKCCDTCQCPCEGAGPSIVLIETKPGCLEATCEGYQPKEEPAHVEEPKRTDE